MSQLPSHKAVFLDRDGCINVEDNHITDINRFRLYPDALPSIRRLNDAGFKIVVVTNQSGIARGLMTEQLVRQTHDLLMEWANAACVVIDQIEYCPHHPEGSVPEFSIVCNCRKPSTGMLDRAAAALNIDFSRSFVVGDKISDIGLGPAAGIKAALVRTGFGEREEGKLLEAEHLAPDRIVDGIATAVEWILDYDSNEPDSHAQWLNHVVTRVRLQKQRYRALLESVPEHKLTDRPAPNVWSAKEVAVHLRRVEQDVIQYRLQKIIELDMPEFLDYEPSDLPEVHGYQSARLDETIDEFEIAREQNLALVVGLSLQQFHRIGYHVTNGPFNVVGWLGHWVDHTDHHLNQIAERRALADLQS